MISAPVIALLYLQFGWQGTFVLAGALGFIWLLPWLVIYKAPPERHAWLSAEERERAAIDAAHLQSIARGHQRRRAQHRTQNECWSSHVSNH